jgi:cytidylate kinase
MIITIDGPIATGKSTIAKKLAAAIGYIYFDTGAMYRCCTYGVIKNHVNIDNPEELQRFLDQFDFDIKVKFGDKRYFVNGEDATNAIRLDEVTSQVSRVSANRAVREKMMQLQRDHAQGVNAVFEGRDMGTVVFPDAQLKIFLTGRNEVRAKRRFDEMKSKFPEESKELTEEKVLQDLLARDEYDTNREISPLRKAPDACEVDTSDMTLDEIVYKILEFKDTRKLRAQQT